MLRSTGRHSSPLPYCLAPVFGGDQSILNQAAVEYHWNQNAQIIRNICSSDGDVASCSLGFQGTCTTSTACSLACIQPHWPALRCAITPKHTAGARLTQILTHLAAMLVVAPARSACPWWLERHACGRSDLAAASCAARLPCLVSGQGRGAEVDCLSGASASPPLCCNPAHLWLTVLL